MISSAQLGVLLAFGLASLSVGNFGKFIRRSYFHRNRAVQSVVWDVGHNQHPAILGWVPMSSRFIDDHRDRRIDVAVASWIDSISFRIQSGSSVSSAILDSASTAPLELRSQLLVVTKSVSEGEEIEVALNNFASSVASSTVTAAVAVLVISWRTGGRAYRQLRQFSESLRERVQLRNEIRALAGQVRASAAILIILPLAFMCGTSMFNGSSRHLLFLTPVGWLILCLGLGLEFLGALWMSKITGRYL